VPGNNAGRSKGRSRETVPLSFNRSCGRREKNKQLLRDMGKRDRKKGGVKELEHVLAQKGGKFNGEGDSQGGWDIRLPRHPGGQGVGSWVKKKTKGKPKTENRSI